MKGILRKFIRSDADLLILRVSVIVIFMLFGTYKWFDFEVKALEPLISNTWLNILYGWFGVSGGSYFLGMMETLTFATLILGVFRPGFGVMGAVMVMVTGGVTLSLLVQLGEIDSFIIKDVLLIGAGVTLLKHDLIRMYVMDQKSNLKAER